MWAVLKLILFQSLIIQIIVIIYTFFPNFSIFSYELILEVKKNAFFSTMWDQDVYLTPTKLQKYQIILIAIRITYLRVFCLFVI